jgi:hypothetical protein
MLKMEKVVAESIKKEKKKTIDKRKWKDCEAEGNERVDGIGLKKERDVKD